MKTFLEFYNEILSEAGVRMRQGRTKPPTKSTSTRKTLTKAQQSIQQATQQPVAQPTPKPASNPSDPWTSAAKATTAGKTTYNPNSKKYNPYQAPKPSKVETPQPVSTQTSAVSAEPQKTPKIFDVPYRYRNHWDLGSREDIKIKEATTQKIEEVKDAIEKRLNGLIERIDEGDQNASKEYLIWSYILLPDDTVF